MRGRSPSSSRNRDHDSFAAYRSVPIYPAGFRAGKKSDAPRDPDGPSKDRPATEPSRRRLVTWNTFCVSRHDFDAIATALHDVPRSVRSRGRARHRGPAPTPVRDRRRPAAVLLGGRLGRPGRRRAGSRSRRRRRPAGAAPVPRDARGGARRGRGGRGDRPRRDLLRARPGASLVRGAGSARLRAARGLRGRRGAPRPRARPRTVGRTGGRRGAGRPRRPGRRLDPGGRRLHRRHRPRPRWHRSRARAPRTGCWRRT